VYYSGGVSTFSCSGFSVARQQLLATSLRLDNRAPFSLKHFCAPDLLLAKFGFGGLDNKIFSFTLHISRFVLLLLRKRRGVTATTSALRSSTSEKQRAAPQALAQAHPDN
jgi:hypothetical protein